MIELGSKVRDKITGFEGVAIGRSEWITGCMTYGLQGSSLGEKGEPPGVHWFDEVRLEVLAAPAYVGLALPLPQEGPVG